jgi:excisionase family DNA binding protein
MEKLLLTVEETAERLSIGRTRAYELVLCGALESVKIGRSRRVPVGALESFVARLRRLDEESVLVIGSSVIELEK